MVHGDRSGDRQLQDGHRGPARPRARLRGHRLRRGDERRQLSGTGRGSTRGCDRSRGPGCDGGRGCRPAGMRRPQRGRGPAQRHGRGRARSAPDRCHHLGGRPGGRTGPAAGGHPRGRGALRRDRLPGARHVPGSQDRVAAGEPTGGLPHRAALRVRQGVRLLPADRPVGGRLLARGRFRFPEYAHSRLEPRRARPGRHHPRPAQPAPRAHRGAGNPAARSGRPPGPAGRDPGRHRVFRRGQLEHGGGCRPGRPGHVHGGDQRCAAGDLATAGARPGTAQLVLRHRPAALAGGGGDQQRRGGARLAAGLSQPRRVRPFGGSR